MNQFSRTRKKNRECRVGGEKGCGTGLAGYRRPCRRIARGNSCWLGARFLTKTQLPHASTAATGQPNPYLTHLPLQHCRPRLVCLSTLCFKAKQVHILVKEKLLKLEGR